MRKWRRTSYGRRKAQRLHSVVENASLKFGLVSRRERLELQRNYATKDDVSDVFQCPGPSDGSEEVADRGEDEFDADEGEDVEEEVPDLAKGGSSGEALN